MTMKLKIVAAFLICAVHMTTFGPGAGFSSRADDLATAVNNGINQVRGTCGPIADDPRLTAAAQRQANDMARNGVGGGHIGSDGSSPQARIADAGYTGTGHTGEVIYWGTGSLATASAAVDGWLASPAHRAIILNCAFTAAGFATAWQADKVIAVGDFAGP